MFKEKEMIAGTEKAALRGIMLREELDYGNTIKCMVSLWWLGLYVLQIFDSPQWLLAFGCVYSLLIAIKAGSNEVADGVEEFSFALPSTRAQRFKAKFFYSFQALLILSLAGVLSLYFNVPQLCWSLFIETGFTEANQPSSWIWYSIALLFPLLTHIVFFCTNILCPGRRGLFMAVIKACVITALITLVIAVMFGNLSTALNNFLIPTLICVAALICLHISYKAYQLKEGFSSHAEKRKSSNKAIAVIMALILVFLLLTFAWQGRAVRMGKDNAEQMQKQYERLKQLESQENQK